MVVQFADLTYKGYKREVVNDDFYGEERKDLHAGNSCSLPCFHGLLSTYPLRLIEGFFDTSCSETIRLAVSNPVLAMGMRRANLAVR